MEFTTKVVSCAYSMIFSTLQWIGLLINHLMGVAYEEWQHAKFYTFAKQLMGGGSWEFSVRMFYNHRFYFWGHRLKNWIYICAELCFVHFTHYTVSTCMCVTMPMYGVDINNLLPHLHISINKTCIYVIFILINIVHIFPQKSAII